MSVATPFTVELRGNLGLRQAARLAEALTDAIAAHPAVVIAAGALEEADISILQVLLAARKTAAGAGKSLTLEPSDSLLRILARAGFLTADGSPATPEGAFWIGARERAA